MKEAAFQIEVEDDDEGDFTCTGESRVLLAMEHQGQCSIPLGCRRGGCGICKVRVLEGEFTTLVMSRAQVSKEEEAEGYALACRIRPQSDMKVRVVHKSRLMGA